MTRKDRLRRVLILCLHCTRNLAYYRAGWCNGVLIPNSSQFWRTVNGNCLNECVLEWCKLFGEKDHHCWRKFVSDPSEFEAALLRHLALDMAAFEEFVNQMHRYRDKFVAHLDSDATMDIPTLDIAKASTCFYHNHVVAKDAHRGDLAGFEAYVNPTLYYEHCEAEATRVYRTFIART